MGRSVSCFKIISCGSDPIDNDELQIPENKGSSDRRRWSFQKKSVRHRVLSNVVNSETFSRENIENLLSADLDGADAMVSQEILAAPQCVVDDASRLAPADSKVSEAIDVPKNGSEVNSHLEDDVAVCIQAAIRGFLAQNELLMLKRVVKLQATVRGHLVRRQALETLRFFLAIIKMQNLVRCRSRSLLESHKDKKSPASHPKTCSKTLVENFGVKANVINNYTEKLLANKFVLQLMESRPKTKLFCIKIDPLKPNPAWNWVERWMVFSKQNAASDINEQPNQANRSAKRQASELENEGKKLIMGHRKASNPSFISAQSKFEELSSASISYNRPPMNLLHQEDGLEPNKMKLSYGLDLDGGSKKKDSNMQELAPAAETDTLKKKMMMTSQYEAKLSGGETFSSYEVTEESVAEPKEEDDNSDVAYIPSPDTSPKSHITITESQGTPCSQLSGRAKIEIFQKNGCGDKRVKSLSAGSRPLSGANHDYPASNYGKPLPRDVKNGKRRNSFGSTRSERNDQATADNSNSTAATCLPHFMQATESARAKILVNNSPRSSPDVQERDSAKKRQSMPGANGRQDSPRIQRSLSEAQPVLKGSSLVPPVHDKKWQR